MAGIVLLDGDGAAVELADADAESLLALTDHLDAATISACPDCRSRVLAALAMADVIDAAAAHPAAGRLVELADDAPTAHLYCWDRVACDHRRWRDPGAQEWRDTVLGPQRPRPRR